MRIRCFIRDQLRWFVRSKAVWNIDGTRRRLVLVIDSNNIKDVLIAQARIKINLLSEFALLNILIQHSGLVITSLLVRDNVMCDWRTTIWLTIDPRNRNLVTIFPVLPCDSRCIRNHKQGCLDWLGSLWGVLAVFYLDDNWGFIR